MNYFGSNIKYIRKNFKLTQKEFAELFGKTESAVSMWEIGARIPPNKIVKKIADFYGLTIDMLVNYDMTKTDKIIERQNEETELLRCYRAMTDGQKKALLSMARALAE